MALEHLHWFNGTGDDITPVIQDGIFKMVIPFEVTSVGLFSSVNIFILEEIFKEHEGTGYDLKKRASYTPLVIRIMKLINDYGIPVKQSLIERYFPVVRNGSSYLGEFLTNNSNYIYSFFDGDSMYYTLTDVGKTYLRNYEEKEEETYADNFRRVVELVRPRSNYDLSAGEDCYFMFRWQPDGDTYDKNIFVYYIDQSDESVYYENERSLCLDVGERLPSIVPAYNEQLNPDNTFNEDWKRWFVPYRFDDGRGDAFYAFKSDGNWDTKSRRVINNSIPLNQRPFQLNIAFTSEMEGTYSRVLDIFMVRKTNTPVDNFGTTELVTNVYKVAEITFFAESVGEDERLRLLLENFGRVVDESDVYVFRDVDVKDDRPDYIKLNEKRKELLLVGEEIYPFIGTYKAFVNALKFFGYNDLRLKEYFVNLRLSNPKEKTVYYTSVDVPLDLKTDFEFDETKDFNDMVFGSIINNKIYQKTSRFGLYYDLNRVTGEVDELGFPIVEDVYIYTNEEILLKLYGLKRLLQKYYLPHHARIVDITGEGIYFAKYKILNWNDSAPIIPIRMEGSIDFKGVPLKGYIKPLDKLLNIFRRELDGLQDVFSFEEDKLLSDISDKILREFIDEGDIDFPFDEEITLDVIKSFYSNYWDLKKVIFEHLKNYLCPVEYTIQNSEGIPQIRELRYNLETAVYDETLGTFGRTKKETMERSLEYSIRLLGLPVLFKFESPKVTWDDLTVRFDELEGLAPFDHSEKELERIAEEETYFGIFHKADNLLTEDEKFLRKLIRGGSKLVTWDNIGYYGCNWVQWYIRHTGGEYCYKVSDTLEKLSSILIFLPSVGFYDASLVAYDMNNTPRIRRKPSYIEVVKEQPDFIAFGRYIKKGMVWDDFNDITLDEFNGVWDYGSYCPLETIWDDCRLSWDDMSYANYKKENFTEPDIKTSEILDYNEDLYKIELSGRGFGTSFQEYSGQRWRNVLVVERDSEEVPLYKNVKISEISNKRIVLDGIYKIRDFTKVNIYRYFRTKDFTLNFLTRKRARVIIKTDFYESFQIGKTLNFINSLTKKQEPYLIRDIQIDFIKGTVSLDIDNDGSLDVYPFIWLEYRMDNYIFKVISSVEDYESGTTELSIYDPNSSTREIVTKGTENFVAEWGIYAGKYIFNVVDFEFNEGNTIVRIEPDDRICHMDTNFIAKWADRYDYTWTEKFATVRNFTYEGMDTLTFEDLSNVTWNMLDYHDSPILGFKIKNIIKPWFWIQIGNQKVEVDIPVEVDKDSYMRYLCGYLNTVELDYFRRFTYYLVENNFIQAIAKFSGQEGLVNISYSPHIEGDTDSYPKVNFQYWNEICFNGYNKPADWNLFEYSRSEVDKFWSMNGAFNFTDFYASCKDFSLPVGNSIFVKYIDEFDEKYELEYYWELWEEAKGKLLMVSRYHYLIWTFSDRGIYSVKLQTKDKKGNTNLYEKRAWITVF